MVWARLVAGIALVGAAIGAWIKSGDAITSGHSAYLILVVATGAAGVGFLIWSFIGHYRKGGVGVALRWTLTALMLGLATATWFLAPIPVQGVDPDELTTGPEVTIRENSDSILMLPTDRNAQDAGVVLLPGALVDSRAYIPLLKPLSAAGYPVVIVKEPLGIAFLATNALEPAKSVTAENTIQVDDWVVVGHSLGGVVAAEVASQNDAAGLGLLAAFPASDISQAHPRSLSVYGTDDQITTGADIESNQPKLPPDTTYVPIDGGIHSYFGDYGLQSGDGTPTISREQQQSDTRAALRRLLVQIQRR